MHLLERSSDHTFTICTEMPGCPVLLSCPHHFLFVLSESQRSRRESVLSIILLITPVKEIRPSFSEGIPKLCPSSKAEFPELTLNNEDGF